MRPDMDYDPSSRRDIYYSAHASTINDEREAVLPTIGKDELIRSIQLYLNNYSDADFVRFYKLSNISTATSLNVLDSISFIEKFGALYVGSLKKTFKDLDVSKIEESLSDIKQTLDESLKHDNVENVYLLPMIMGILEALLKYENY
jgi:hypothetical protein